MIIDFHTHVAPPEMRDRPIWKGKCPMTIENVLDAQKIAGIDRTIISYPYHELREFDAKLSSRPFQATTATSPRLRKNTTASRRSPARSRMAAMLSFASSSAP